ncbi:MAG: MFS transporter [Roseburia sp.]
MKKRIGIWNKNFFLLWQGQMVSVFGDALYTIALDFFVLEVTGSTAIMGTVMALVTMFRIIFGPISGVIVDRFNRKILIVLADVIRGLGILFIALAAKQGFLEIWMIMVGAIVLGICSSFFNPAIESVLPDIVPAENMIRASSIYQIAVTGMDVLGQSVGGALYAVLGAPIIFLINGISYLVSAATEGFIAIPTVEAKNISVTFIEDFKDGLRFVFKNEGLVRTIIMSFFINFLFGMIRVLLIPWFLGNSQLGMTKYGILNAVSSVGLMVGMLVLSLCTIKSQHKYRIYIASILLFIVSIGVGAFFNQYVLILIFFFMAFGFQFVFNTVLNSTIMLKTPANKRGKVSAMKTTLGMAISPLGNFVGGILCEFLDARTLIISNTFVAVIVVAIVVINPAVRAFLNNDNQICE